MSKPVAVLSWADLSIGVRCVYRVTNSRAASNCASVTYGLGELVWLIPASREWYRSSPRLRQRDYGFQQQAAALDEQPIIRVFQRRVADAAVARHEQHSRGHSRRHRTRIVPGPAAHPPPRPSRSFAD